MKYVFEGNKMIGCQDASGQWWKVEKDCVYCGECCNDVNPDWAFALGPEGGCKYVDEHPDGRWKCGLHKSAAKPFDCCVNDPHARPDYCQVVLVKIDDPCSLL